VVIAYSSDAEGNTIRRIVAGGVKRTFRGERRPDRHFSETLLRNYYTLECEQGSRFKSSLTKDRIKRTHETALARFRHTGDTFRP